MNTYDIKEEFKYSNNISEEYISNRLLAQVLWYDKKSILYQKYYKNAMIISIVINSLIPIVTLFMNCNIGVKLAIVILSSSTSVISSILTLHNYKDHWINYRTNCELLKSYLHQYYSSSGLFNTFDDEEKFRGLVTICEKHFTDEFSVWNNANKNQSSTDS